MISPKQAQLARIMLDLSQAELAEKLGWAHQTISKIEKGSVNPPASRIKELEEFYESAGVEFIEGNGVRQKQEYVRRLQGSKGFSDFLDDVYETAIKHGTPENPAQVFLSNVVHENWIRWMGPDKWLNHTNRMTKDKNVMDVRIIVKDNDWNFPASDYSKYKWFPEELFNDQSFYSYHDRLAFLNFKDNEVEIMIMKHREFAEGYRTLFQIAWDHVAKTPIR